MSKRNENRPGYKKTKLGWIPGDWETRRISEVADYVDYRGKTPVKSTYGVFLLTASNVQMGYIDYEVSKDYIPENLYESVMARGKPKVGDVIITTEAPLGNVAQLDEEKLALAQRIIKYRSKWLQLTNCFLKWFMMGPVFQNKLLLESTGSTVKGIKGSRLHNMVIAIPPLPEQKAIADILCVWDRAIEQTRKLIDAKKRLKQGLMQQLLTGRIRFPEFGKPAERLGELPEGWKELKAKELFQNRSNKNITNVPVLSVTQDQGVVPRDSLDRKINMSHENTDTYKLVEPGDFVISLRSFQGGLEYSRIRGLVSPAYHVIYPKKEISDEFYKHYFKSYRFIGHIAIAVIGIRDGKQISFSDFSFMKIPYPQPGEQMKIASVLDACDQEIKVLEKKKEALINQKQGLMQKLLTGEIRVKYLGE